MLILSKIELKMNGLGKNNGFKEHFIVQDSQPENVMVK